MGMEDSRPLWGYDVLRNLDVLPDWMIFLCLLLIQNGWLVNKAEGGDFGVGRWEKWKMGNLIIIGCLVLSLVLNISVNSFAEWFEQFSLHLGATQNYLSPAKISGLIKRC